MQFSLKTFLLFANGAAAVFYVGWTALLSVVVLVCGGWVYEVTGNWILAVLAGIVVTYILIGFLLPAVH